jgi:putative oxidoreductase
MIDSKFAPYGAFVLRIALGVMFLAHAYLKVAVFGVAGFEGFLGQSALPAALAWPIILGEVLGGVALLAGFYSRVVAIALLPVLLGAISIHAPNGGWEYPAFLAMAALAHALIGEGAFALRPLAPSASDATYAGRGA